MDELARLENRLLVLRSQTGDRKAFGKLVERWQNPLWRHAHYLTGDRDAAWDALQDTWVAVVRGIDKLTDPDAFPKWVLTVLRNRCFDWVRRQQRNRRLTEQLKLNSLESATHEGDAATRVDMQAALAKLDISQREVVSLHYSQGFGTGEIAEVLEIPEGTVKSRLHQARKQLRRIMEKANE